MSPSRTLIAAVFAALVAAGPVGAAFADPPHCPPGQAKKGNCRVWYDDRYWREDRAYEQGYRDGRHDARWEIGRRLPRDIHYVVIRDYDRYHLRPPPRGHYYAEVDGRVLLIAAATSIIVDALVRY